MPQRVVAATIDFLLSQLPTLLPQDALNMQGSAFDFIDIKTYKHFFLSAVKISGNGNLGLMIGARIHANALGILGYILENSQTLGDAINNLLLYHTILSQSLSISMTVGSRYVKITLVITPPENPPLDRYANDINMSALATILNSLVDENIRPSVVKFAHARPECLDSYHPIFGTNLEFGAGQNMIYYPKEILSLPVRHQNATMLEFFKAQAERILEQNKESYSMRVTRVLSELLSYRTPDIKEVAVRLETTSRTLQNRLKSENVTFQELVVLAKKQLACHYLKCQDMQIKEIAERLGYSEPSAFNRAFKQWTTLTPKEFRQQESF